MRLKTTRRRKMRSKAEETGKEGDSKENPGYPGWANTQEDSAGSKKGPGEKSSIQSISKTRVR